ncbi:very-long-chain (3R)-3-hydroxyacyl-CoA dehydratase PASTICCINO 2A-like [Oryza brachyantha]|uniref:very-long-chain (3R)-3-hydroxyacyl-CoA dehydratase PASTICCINO 2A-like n=1 Tax=Oryza brachyantha TaxID=4533 RepID=UPI0007768450|nr:very-long-chain (3R)-3-hydroxyacyl-CoA dehydratase PASTICCINO 2A-like [Oryza brachyantha]
MAADDSVMRSLYLSAYNWVVFIGWVQVFCYMTLELLVNGHEGVYAAIERPLLFAQTAAIMEILCSILVSSTLPQITGRLFITWGILWSFPETHSHILVTSLIISWSITEVIRYSFFGMQESFGFTPSWFVWLRYSTFIICYPVGMVSEVVLIYIAFPFMKASGKYCFRMSNKWNFSFNYFYFSALLMALYVPAFPHLLLYMVAQRKKALSKEKTT